MANQAHEELLNSLKRLYDTAEYSDLTISCGHKNYLVHKAVVCPRSEFFASACCGIASEVTHEKIVNLPDEDPTAVEMVVHYLYHLDYSTNSTVGQDYTNGYTNGTHESIETPLQIRAQEGHTEKSAHHEGTPDEAPMEESSSAQGVDESGSVNLTSKNKKKNKKKKQKRLSSGSISTATTLLNGTPAKDADLSNGTGCTEEYVVPAESPSPSSLVLHAKVYALSKKYRINGLKLLALDKFRIEADQDWDTGDFLLAAKEVYTSTSAVDQDIRDAVTTIVYEHPEILDRDETQELIKGLDLGFDVLKRVRAKGGFL